MSIDTGNADPASLSALRRETVHLVAVKSAVALAGRLISVPCTIAATYLLGPFQVGVLAILQLVHTYAGYAHLGILDALYRNVPIAYGRGDADEARRITHTAYTGWLISLVATTIGLWLLFAAGVTVDGALNPRRLVLLTAIIWVNGALTFLRDFAKAEGRLMAIARSDVIQTIVAPLATLPAVYWLALDGALLVLVATSLLAVVQLYALLGRPVLRLRFDAGRTVALIRIGALVLVNRTTDSLFWAVDLMVLTALRTPIEVGIYSVALAVLKATAIFAGGFNQMIYRKMMSDTGAFGNERRDHYRKYVGGLLVAYLLFNSVITGLATLGFIAVVQLALTDYERSVDVLVLLTLGFSTYSSLALVRYFMDAIGQLPRRLWIVGAAAVVNAALDYAVLSAGYDVVAVAWAGTACFFVNGAVMLALTFKQVHGSYAPAISFIARLLAVSLFGTGFLAVCAQWQAVGLVAADFVIKALAFTGLTSGLYLLLFRPEHPERELRPVLAYAWTAVSSRVLAWRSAERPIS